MPTSPATPSTLRILLVEDDAAHAELTSAALDQAPEATSVTVVGDGDEALGFLRDGLASPGGPVDLILLDLRLPRRSGHDLLAELKGDDAFRRIPVVILSSSGQQDDVVRAYEAGANAYVRKPDTFADLVRVGQALCGFWAGAATLPPR
jgi:two-component system response regulator